MDAVFIAVLSLVCLGRLTIITDFLVRCLRSPAEESGVVASLEHLELPSEGVSGKPGSEQGQEPRSHHEPSGKQGRRRVTALTSWLTEATADDHDFLLSIERRNLESMLLVGSIALAAWSQLFVSSDSGPAHELAGVSLGLLFIGSSVLLILPLLARNVTVYLATLVNQAAYAIGYGALALSLLSIAERSADSTAVTVVAIVVTLVLVGLEVADVERGVWLNSTLQFPTHWPPPRPGSTWLRPLAHRARSSRR